MNLGSVCSLFPPCFVCSRLSSCHKVHMKNGISCHGMALTAHGRFSCSSTDAILSFSFLVSQKQFIFKFLRVYFTFLDQDKKKLQGWVETALVAHLITLYLLGTFPALGHWILISMQFCEAVFDTAGPCVCLILNKWWVSGPQLPFLNVIEGEFLSRLGDWLAF